MVELSESYRGGAAPAWMHSTVERLLGSLPDDFLSGLGTIVLTDSESIGRGKTGRVRGRKYNRRDCRGFYHAGTSREVAWIELVADNMIAGMPKPFFRIQFTRDLVVSQTLFHEIGHHLDATLGSPARRGEVAAEEWCRRLSRKYFRQRYWYLKPVFSAAALLVAALRLLRCRGR
jgi:hypothetical protein